MSEYLLARIEALQHELDDLKKAILYRIESPKRKTRLKGLWGGVDVSENDLEEAKRAVFKDAYQFKG